MEPSMIVKTQSFFLSIIVALLVLSTHSADAQWTQTTGPGGGSILSFGVIGNTVFAGTSGGGLFRSTNFGTSWNAVRLGRINSDVKGITASGSSIFAASDSLYLSTDSGITWRAISLLPGESGPLVVLGKYLILGSFDGIFRSSDRGQTWERAGDGFVVCLLVKDGMLFAGAWSFGLQESTDSGSTWSTVRAGGILDGASIQSLAANGNDIFAGGYYDEGFFRSTDDGVTWDSSNTGMINLVGQGHNCTIMSLYEDGSDLYAGTAEGLYQSSDSGLTWRLILMADVEALTRSGNNLLGGTRGGIQLSSDNGLRWNSSNSGLINTSVPAMASIGTHLFAGISGNGVYRSNDSGNTWTAVNSGLNGSDISGFTSIDTTLFAIAGNELFATSDYGDSWHLLDSQIRWPIVAFGSNLLAAKSGFSLSTDGGKSWSQRSAGFGWGELVCLMAKGNVLYAGNSFGDCGTVYRSMDSGSTWTNLEVVAGCTDIYSLANDGDLIFSGTGRGYNEGGAGIFRRADTDTSWTAINTGLPDLSQRAIVTIASDKNNIFFGTEGWGNASLGMFFSSDYGSTWSLAMEGLTSTTILQLLIFPPYIFAGSQGAGVWRRPLSDFSRSFVNSISEKSSRRFSVSESYPNPSESKTTITYTLDSEMPTHISLFNALGVRVWDSGERMEQAGIHSSVFDLANYSPGVYYCRFEVNGDVQSRRLVLNGK